MRFGEELYLMSRVANFQLILRSQRMAALTGRNAEWGRLDQLQLWAVTAAPAFQDVPVAPTSETLPPVTQCRLPDPSVPCLAALASAAHQKTAAP